MTPFDPVLLGLAVAIAFGFSAFLGVVLEWKRPR